MWRTLQRCQCVGNHHHDVIAGSCKPAGFGRMPVSKYTELYTAMFGRRLSRAIQCSCQIQEKVFGKHQEFSFVTNTAAEESEPKRRRLAGKFHPEFLFVPPSQESPSSDRSQTVSLPQPGDVVSQQILEMAEKSAPRVGPVVIRDGPLFQAVQDRYPDRQIICLDVCRGINRMRVCPIGEKGIAPFRRAIGRHRTDRKIFEDSQWEHWETLSHRQQIRYPFKIACDGFCKSQTTKSDRSHHA